MLRIRMKIFVTKYSAVFENSRNRNFVMGYFFRTHPVQSIILLWNCPNLISRFLNSGSTDYIEGPRNMVVSAGQPMEMECRADRNSTVNEWSMQRPFTSNKITIFVNSKGQKK